MSREDQRALGLQVAAQVYKEMPVLPDNSPETQYVRRLGQKLVATIPSQYSWPFEFHVVPQKEINAFALPGGPMFINIGTITSAANEAQLAGVMAHEMAHVYMQHSAKQAGKAQTTNLLAGLASMALGMTVGDKAGGLVGQLGQMGIQIGAQGVMMKYSRSDEAQADAVGSMILYKAGYNPQAMVDFFKTVETQSGKGGPQWLSSHPNPENRQQAVRDLIRTWPPAKYTTNTPGFVKTRKQAMQVKAYTADEIAQGAKSGKWAAHNKQSGATFNSGGPDVFPASAPAFRTSQEPAALLQSVMPRSMVAESIGPLRMRRPDNWPVRLPQQPGQFIVVAPQAGVTADGIGYGMLINGISASQVQRRSIDQVTRQLILQMQNKSGLQLLGNTQRITVGGIEGRSAMLRSESPFRNAQDETQEEKDWLVTVPQRDGSVILMIFVAPEAHFSRLQPTYEAMLKSMQFR